MASVTDKDLSKVKDQLKESIELVKSVEGPIDNPNKVSIQLAAGLVAKFRKSIKLGNKCIDKLNSQCSDCSKVTSDEESELEDLLNSARELDAIINIFLLGATSTSLACPFKTRKESFKCQKKNWCCIFIGSILVSLILALVGCIKVNIPVSDLDPILQYYLVCLPFIIPIALFVIYAGRHHSRLSRLEEDYAHKEAWLKLFEGYKVQFKYIDPTGKATLNLVAKTLAVLSLPPDRL